RRGTRRVRAARLRQRRALTRLDPPARTCFALIAPGSAFAGSLLELALAADRSYMLAGGEPPATIELSALNHGALPTSAGVSRLEARFLGEPARRREVLSHRGPFDAAAAHAAGLVTFAPDALDWDEEVRLAIEERAAMSPDPRAGRDANLRFPGPEALETKIFGRLSAWQNWIFIRPNAP